MKQRNLLKHLKKHGCEFFCEGGSHTIYINPSAGKSPTVPRHREINDFLVKKICKDLEIPAP